MLFFRSLLSTDRLVLQKNKKRKWVLFFACFVYGRFLTISIASTAIPTIITMIIAMTPYINVVCDASPLSGVAVGAGVGEAGLA